MRLRRKTALLHVESRLEAILRVQEMRAKLDTVFEERPQVSAARRGSGRNGTWGLVLMGARKHLTASRPALWLRAAAGGVEVEEEVGTKEETRLSPPWNVIVHNDPITLMSYVTMVLRKLFGYPTETAHSLMMEVHTRGRAIVWTGDCEQAEMYVQKLHSHQLLASMEPQ